MAEDKPFFLVPWVRPDSKRNCAANGSLSGRLKITITAQTPLHFGAGQLGHDEKASLFVNLLNQENDQIALPGSSFKGMLRSVFEAVSESCMPTERDLRCSHANALCPACAMFGFLGYKGKLRFSSFPAEGEIENLALPQLYSHPSNLNQRRFYRHSTAYRQITDKAKGELYECLSPGAVLRGTITYQSLTEDQLGGLLFALGLGWGGPIYHKLGYGKPAYLGSVRLETAQEETEKTLLSSVRETSELDKLAADYYEKHRDKIGEVVAILQEAWGIIGEGNGWDMQILTY